MKKCFWGRLIAVRRDLFRADAARPGRDIRARFVVVVVVVVTLIMIIIIIIIVIRYYFYYTLTPYSTLINY